MPLLLRSTLIGTLAVVAVFAAFFIVKAVLAIATLVLTCVVAVYLLRLVRTFARRIDARREITTFRRG